MLTRFSIKNTNNSCYLNDNNTPKSGDRALRQRRDRQLLNVHALQMRYSTATVAFFPDINHPTSRDPSPSPISISPPPSPSMTTTLLFLTEIPKVLEIKARRADILVEGITCLSIFF